MAVGRKADFEDMVIKRYIDTGDEIEVSANFLTVMARSQALPRWRHPLPAAYLSSASFSPDQIGSRPTRINGNPISRQPGLTHALLAIPPATAARARSPHGGPRSVGADPLCPEQRDDRRHLVVERPHVPDHSACMRQWRHWGAGRRKLHVCCTGYVFGNRITQN
jgi:hypothetical protein